MKFFHLASNLIILSLAINISARENTDKTTGQQVPKERQKVVEKEISLDRLWFKGEIIDENGEPQDQVKVKIEKVITLGLQGNKRSTEEKLLNHNFQFGVAKCNLIHLKFSKDGFYPFSQSFMIKDFKKSTDGVYLCDLKIKMSKFEISYKSKRDYFILTYTPGSSRTFFIPAHLPEGNSCKKIPDIGALKNIPEHCFYLEAGRNKDGQIITLNRKGIKVPVEFKLCLQNKKNPNKATDSDGLIICPNIHDPKEMKEAPLTGYSSEVIFSSLSKDGSIKNIFFYYRVNGYYGKGYICNSEIFSDGTFNIMIYYRQNMESISPNNRFVGGEIN